MPRKKLDKTKNASIQVPILPEEKEAFDAWCQSESTTMAEVVRQAIAPYITKGKKLLEVKEDE